MNHRNFYLFLFITILFNYGCRGKLFPDDNLAEENEIKYGLLFILKDAKNYFLEDNLNGTVALKAKDGFGNIRPEIGIFKKCLQGQVYRSVQNDCQGAGTLADFWNASLLQYCNTNTNACNDTYGNLTGLNSQIYVSCNSDTTAGLKWYPVNYSLGDLMRTAEFTAVYKDFPVSDNTGIWLSYYSSNSDYTSAYFTGFPYSPVLALKSSMKYALCQAK